jgi:hypothetical protein
MAFPDSFRQKGAAGLGQKSGGLETFFGSHASKYFDLKLFNVSSCVERSHPLTGK